MIVQERAEGTPFSRLRADELDPERARRIADACLGSVFDQILVRGVFHADLHPGNLILGEASRRTAVATSSR